LHNTLVDDRTYSDEENSDVNIKNLEMQPTCKKKNIKKLNNDLFTKPSDNLKKKKKLRKIREIREIDSIIDSNKKYFQTYSMKEEEMIESRAKRKLTAMFIDAPFKCESCVEGYKSQSDLDVHIVDVHTIDQVEVSDLKNISIKIHHHHHQPATVHCWT
jgi:hypothetical protein